MRGCRSAGRAGGGDRAGEGPYRWPVGRAAGRAAGPAARARLGAALAIALFVLGAPGAASADFLRGVTVSCPAYGQAWGTPLMRGALDELSGLGVGWVAVHPYAQIARDGTVRWSPAAETWYLRGAVRAAREAGVSLFWTPHLAFWGSFAWRGAIEFGDDAAAWARFFEGYRAFIVDQARFAEASGLKLFSLGNEYERTMVGHEAEWRAIIAAVRAVYHGELTYSANWDGVERVPFWDALDTIAVQAYFPLAAGAEPTRAELEVAWDRVLGRLAKLSARHKKPILFQEIGYSRAARAAERPWEAAVEDDPRAIALRALLIDVALDRVVRAPFVRGMFWWKWLVGPEVGQRDFSMRDPEARAALARRWSKR